MDTRCPEEHRGRGAVANPGGRFEGSHASPFDDGWGSVEGEPPKRPTTVVELRPRSILTRNRSPDLGFDVSINPYQGCEHGCFYCYARPSHGFHGLSSGLDFETRLFSKPDAAALLRSQLRRPGHVAQTIVIGANTDPYQPIERRLEITRELLQVFVEFRHPVSVITRSALVTRDLDLLTELARQELVQVAVSVTSLDPQLSRRMEPRAAAPARRLATIEALAEAGVPVLVMSAPMIPGLNDCELEAILEAAAWRGARRAGMTLVRLPHELAELFEGWLRVHVPDRADKVLSLLRSTREGELSDSAFGRRMRGSGPYAELLQQRFELTRRRLGLDEETWAARTDLFRLPPARGDQLPLFGG